MGLFFSRNVPVRPRSDDQDELRDTRGSCAHNQDMQQRRFRSHGVRRVVRPPREKLPYRRRGPLLSPGEAAFYRVLRLAVGRQFHVAFKPRLADLLTCAEAAWANGFGHMIARHHVDFALCDYRTTEVLVAIELDDKSHNAQKRVRRDAFLESACCAAGLPLVRIRAATWYNAPEISLAIAAALRRRV